MRKAIKALWKKLDEVGYAFDFCFLEDEGKTLKNIYYNPDANSNGQLVVDIYSVDEDILPYLESIEYDLDAFQFAEICSEAKEYLYDLDDDNLADDILCLAKKCFEESRPRYEVFKPLLPKSNLLMETLREHIGNKVNICKYGDDCYALEDEKTNEVIFDSDAYDLKDAEEKDFSEMTPSELFTKMTDSQKEGIFRMVWADYIKEDVEGILMGDIKHKIPEDEAEYDALVEEIVNDYVYNGNYENERPYWDNIDALIEKHTA